MKGILIDPKTRTITENDAYNGDFRSIYPIIGAELFDIVHVTDTETMYVDDEGLINGNGRRNGFFYLLGDNPIALAGKALILGSNSEGDSTATTLTLDEVKAMVRFGQPIRHASGKVDFVDTTGKAYPLSC